MDKIEIDLIHQLPVQLPIMLSIVVNAPEIEFVTGAKVEVLKVEKIRRSNGR